VTTGAKTSARPRRVLVGPHPAPAGHAEGGHLRGTHILALELVEELGVLGIAGREAGLDVVDPDLHQVNGNGNLLADTEAHALPLESVAEGGVIEVDARHLETALVG
jgi:hypothetical protein